MTPPSKVFLIGLIAALICFGAGPLIVMRTNAHLQSLVAACHAESEKAEHSTAAVSWGEKDPLVCEPQELAAINALVGIQAQIAAEYKRLLSMREWSLLVSVVIAVMAGIPFVWYFLLRRIREVSGALVGRQ